MPERSSESQLFWIPRASLLLTTTALIYYLTWHVLTSRELAARWLAPIWVTETYLLIGLAIIFATRAPAHRRVERRSRPRVPAAIPIRYATEEGQVGIGTLVDITEQGAGLLLPKMTLDATRVWIQFLWFDDRIGTQGRVIYAQEIDDGIRLGLELLPLHPETQSLLTNFVIPYGASGHGHNGGSRNGHDRNGHRADAHGALTMMNGRRRPPQLPVQVEKDRICAWAIAEDVTDQGAVLLLPESFPKGTRVRMAAWGNGAPREAEVVRWESLKHAPSGLFRVEVRHLSPS